jgi:cellobiose-specific phosphotransferase system component IIC
MVFVRIILGLIIIAASVALLKYSVQVADFTGKIELAEKYLGSPLAGTYTFYKLFAIFMMILAVIWIFGGFSGILPI